MTLQIENIYQICWYQLKSHPTNLGILTQILRNYVKELNKEEKKKTSIKYCI
jgi:hypothetical protein